MQVLVHGSHIFFISGWDSGRGLIISNWHGFQNEIFFWSSRHEISSDEQQSKLAHLSTVKQTDEPKGCVTEKKKTQLGAAGWEICRKSNQFLVQRNGADAIHAFPKSPCGSGWVLATWTAHSRIWSLSSFSFERSQSSWGMNNSICQKKDKVRRGSTGWNFQQQKEKNNNNVTTTVFSDFFLVFEWGKWNLHHPLFFVGGLRHVFGSDGTSRVITQSLGWAIFSECLWWFFGGSSRRNNRQKLSSLMFCINQSHILCHMHKFLGEKNPSGAKNLQIPSLRALCRFGHFPSINGFFWQMFVPKNPSTDPS